MPSCITCGGENFDVCDGLYYCSMCQTQSQDLRVEVEETTFADIPSRTLLMKGKKKQKGKKVRDKGRPWTIYEGYQFVLKAQVKTLIELGADPKLDEVVFRLWALYLSKIEIAFCENEKLIPTVFKKYARNREMFRGGMEDPEVIPVRSIRGCKRGYYTPASERKKKKYIPKFVVKLEWMHLYKNLAFCLLGLMFTNNLTTASDLIRWIKDGTLPFRDLTPVIPDDTKLSAYDAYLFKALLPSAEYLKLEATKMAHYLGLTEFPPFPIEQLISKYIVLMDLPGEMHGLVMNLVRRLNPNMHYVTNLQGVYRNYIPPYEAIAMSFIIITIKLWFGLDDKTERELSTYSKQLMDVMKNNRQPLFVFDDWKVHFTLKIKKQMNISLLLTETETMEDISDVDAVLKFYMEKDTTKQAYKLRYPKQTLKSKIYNLECREGIRRPFLSLSKKWNLNQSADTEEEPVKPLSTSKIYDDPMDILNESLESSGNPKDECFDEVSKGSGEKEKGDYFRNCTMRHITHSKEFLESLLTSKSQMDIPRRKDVSRNESKPDLMDVLSQSGDSSDSDFSQDIIFSLKSGQGEPSQRIPYSRVDDTSSKNSSQEAISEAEIKSITEKFVNAAESYILYKEKPEDTDYEVNYHKCYFWLLNMCAAMTEGNVRDIAKCVTLLQPIFVTSGFSCEGTKMSDCEAFVKKYLKTKNVVRKPKPTVNDDDL